MKKRLFIVVLLAAVLMLSCYSNLIMADGKTSAKIEQLIADTAKKAQIPGASVTVVNQGDTDFYHYGYAGANKEKVVHEDTLFELGSMSKSFTALGIFLLEQQGYITLEDNIQEYLPWLIMNNKKSVSGVTEAKLTISNFLYHTSGVPYHTIGSIPVGETDDMLEKTVRNLVGVELDFPPGSEYFYSTINYDVLALVIQEVTGQTYEAFMEESIIKPLGLTDTYFFREEHIKDRIADGHKVSMFVPRRYEAPVYRGNTAAGYIISSARDMERWMRIQLGLANLGESWTQLIERSHQGDTSVPAHGQFYYAGGWQVHLQGSSIAHGGTNPNYSSMMILKPEHNIGICVLTNTNSGEQNILQKVF